MAIGMVVALASLGMPRSASAQVTVTAGPVTAVQGQSGSTTVTVSFAASLSNNLITITFGPSSVLGLPTGATASFSPTSCVPNPSCSVSLTIATSPATSTGSFPINVVAFSGLEQVGSTASTLTVIPAFNYSLAASPAAVTVTAGGAPGSTTITAALLAGTTQAVAFSLSALPAGVTAAFSSPSCNPTCSTTVTITASAGAAASTSTITVTGTSANTANKTTTFTLAVNAAFDYSLAANPGNVAVTAGGAPGSTTITATLLAGTTQAVTFSLSALPAGVTAAFSVPSCSPTCSTTVTLTAAPGATASTSTITVTGTSANTANRTTTFTLAVNAAFDYSLAANPGNVAVTAGGAPGSTTITATLLAGTTQAVTFSLSPLPAGVTATFSVPSCSPTCSTTVTLTAAPGATASTSTITVTGTSANTANRTTTFTLAVNAAFNYSLAANPGNVVVTAGGAPGSTTITATLLAGTTQAVTFSLSALPAGVTAAFSAPSCSPTCSTTVTITAAPGATASTSTITVTGTSANTANRTTTFTLAVNAAFDYSLAANPGTVTVTAGGAAGSTTITATLLAGATQAVSFSVSALPAGVAAAFSVPSCNPTCSTTLTITATSAAAASTSTITVTGTSPNTPNRTTTVALTVNVLRTLTIISGNNQAGVINAPLPKPLVVSVTPATPAVTVIWEVTGGAIPSAASTPTVNGLAQITLTLGPTPGPVTVRVSIAGDFAAAAVTFVVNDATTAAVAGLKTFSVLGNLAVTTATVQATNIGIRLAALRRGAGGGVSVSGLSVNVAGQTVPLEAMTALVTSGPGGGASADPAKGLGGLGIFLNGQGTFGDQNPNAREPGFKFHTEGLTLGTDYRVSENIVLGAAAGYLHTTSTLDAAGGRVTLRGLSISAFGSYYQGDRFYVDAIATYGWNDFGVTRNVAFADTSATAKSDPDGRQLTVSMSAGYNVNVGALTVGPTARATYINVRIDGFQERGADLFNLRVNSQRIESLAADVGAQLSYAISTPWGVLSPLARAEWEHEFKGGSRIIAGSLAADPLGTVFGAPTNTPDRDYVNLAVGLTATLPRGTSAFAHYETVLGRDRVSTHSFTAGLRFQFE